MDRRNKQSARSTTLFMLYDYLIGGDISMELLWLEIFLGRKGHWHILVLSRAHVYIECNTIAPRYAATLLWMYAGFRSYPQIWMTQRRAMDERKRNLIDKHKSVAFLASYGESFLLDYHHDKLR